MSEANKVKCSECGFLYLNEVQQGYQVEAEERFRVRGYQWNSDRIPRCFVRAHNLHSVLENASSRSDENSLAIITEERECDQFYPWRNGFTAKEHAHMLEREEERKLNQRALALNLTMQFIAAFMGFVGALIAAVIGFYGGKMQ